MKGLSISGGGMRVLPMMEAARQVVRVKGYKPDWYSGVSSGLIVGLALALGIEDKAIALLREGKLPWMKVKPITDDGKLSFSSYWSILSGKNFLGVQQVDKVLRQMISVEVWENYRNSYTTPRVYGMAVCIEDRSKMLVDFKDLDFEMMIRWACASCAVPFWMKDEEIDGKHYCDGGWRDHNPSVATMLVEKQTTELVSIYTTPKWENGYPKGLIPMLNKIIAGYTIETSENDWALEGDYCREKKIYNRQYRLRDVLNHPYDEDKTRIAASVELALLDVKDFPTK